LRNQRWCCDDDETQRDIGFAVGELTAEKRLKVRLVFLQIRPETFSVPPARMGLSNN
jgi:hypothetical protein